MQLTNLNRVVSGYDSEIFSESGSKLFFDNVYGSIRLPNKICKLIHTPEFQRLQNIKQLGFSYTVFPGATGTRFQHSIGVCYLSYLLCMKIRNKYPDKEYEIKELGVTTKLTDQIILYIMIGGLFHDIQHNEYSHVFDHIVKEIIKHPNTEHEIRSIIVTRIVCKRELNYNENEINFITSLINPSEEHTGVLYQIVSNNLNGLDVDKFDYLRRDPTNIGLSFKFDPIRILEEFIIDKNNNIAYSKHCSQDVLDCYFFRYKFHTIVYAHKTVKIIEEMFTDIFKLVDPIFKISNSILDVNKFIRRTDEKIFIDLCNAYDNIDIYTDEQKDRIIKAYNIYQNILSRKLYKAIFYDIGIKLVDVKNFVSKFENIVDIEKTFKIIVVKNGFVSESKPDPFKSIYFYDDPNENTFTIDKTYISGLLNGTYSENKILLVCKDRELAVSVREKWKQYKVENNIK